VSADAKNVRLSGDVRLERTPAGAPPLLVETARLDVAPEQERASTDTPVTLTQGRSVVRGSGLVADNKSRTVSLLGPVRGAIQRQSKESP
jgi:lipopolysaccharide export system protein LptC